ncbi:hypothetical protein PSV08DRAFT_361332 [Bipolaris maydis]|uniref:uncharacterized protein n=1 Tax=Cochliobolus heterostrophus TaxID=5016 RepID=UPI0024D0E208|nr:hypothetical protein PSV08DRAFT_361332 [Bipolaris maydis]
MTSIALSSQKNREHIERWQQEISSKPEGDHGIIARMFDTCLGLLRNLIQHSSPTWITTPGHRTLRQGYATLQLWEHGHGVVEGKLDDHLKRSTEVRQATIETLIHLCRCLMDGISNFVLAQMNDDSVRRQHAAASELYSEWKWYLKAADESSSEEESDSGDDHEEEDSLPTRVNVMIRRAKTYINCLIGLGTALECPAPDESHDDEPGVVGVGPRFAQDYHTDLIQAKYPEAEIHLVQVLGKISWSRFLRMQRERENNTAAAPELQGLLAPLTTKSTGFSSEFQDSWIGTSLAKSKPSYAESTVSFMTCVSGGERVRIPPLPAEGKNGRPFECIACAGLIRAKNNREWRKHLFSDLQPYNCFYHECHFNATAFTNLQTWKDHLEFEHNLGPAWEAIKCPLCLNLTGDGKSAILTHFARHMEDVALLALPPAVETYAESEVSLDRPFDINEVKSTPPRESEPARSPSNPLSSPHLNAQPRPQPAVPPHNWDSGDSPNPQEISELLDMEVLEHAQNPSKWASKEWPVQQKIKELLDKKVHELEQESIIKGSEEWQNLHLYVLSIISLLTNRICEYSSKVSDYELEEWRNLQKTKEPWDERRQNSGQKPLSIVDCTRYPIKVTKRTFEGDTTIINGYLELESFTGGIYLMVFDQNRPHNELLRQQLSKGIECRRVGERSLLCAQKNGTGLLLDFEVYKHCVTVRMHIQGAIYDAIHAYQIDRTDEPSELASPLHTNLTTPPEHVPNSPSATDGNALLAESLEEPFLSTSQPYLLPSDSEPKSPSLNPDVEEKASPPAGESNETSMRSSRLRAKQPQVEVSLTNDSFFGQHQDLEGSKGETQGILEYYSEDLIDVKTGRIWSSEIFEASSSQSKETKPTKSDIDDPATMAHMGLGTEFVPLAATPGVPFVL